MHVFFPSFLSGQFPSDHHVPDLLPHVVYLEGTPSSSSSSAHWLTLAVTFPSKKTPWALALTNENSSFSIEPGSANHSGINGEDSGNGNGNGSSESDCNDGNDSKEWTRNHEQQTVLDFRVTFPNIQSLDYLSWLVVSRSVSLHLLALVALWLRREREQHSQTSSDKTELLRALTMTNSGQARSSPRRLLKRRHCVVLHFGMEEFASQVDLAG